MEFTFAAYEKLVGLLKKKEFVFSDYHNYKKNDKTVILRHDIDVDIKKALEMAELENSLGITSTYFVLISSDLYNVFSKKNESLLKKICSLGHTVGLHFDEVKYEDDSDIVSNIEKEADILERCLAQEVTTVSMHRPSQKTLNSDYRIKNGSVINSYGTEFFKEFKYVSDSRRNWREDVCQIVNTGGGYNRLHILTHPFWYDIEEKSMKQSLSDFVSHAVEERYGTLSENIRDLDEVLRLQELK